MNICFVTSNFPNLRSGGIENVTFRLAQGFKTKGHNVYCICAEAKPDDVTNLPFEYTSLDNVNDIEKYVIQYLQTNQIEFVINQSVEWRWFNLISRIKPQFHECRFIKAHHTDPSYMIKGVVDTMYSHVDDNKLHKYLNRISPLTLIRKHKRAKYTKSLYNSWIELYDRIVLLSKYFIDDFSQLAGHKKCDRILSISNPVDFNHGGKDQNKEKIVLYVGRLNQEAKRPDRLLAIWAKIHNRYLDWNLVFVGDGPMRPQLEVYARDAKLKNVSFLGQIDPSNLYKKASIICITSSYEGFSLVCGEALSYGVIPIAFDSFGAVKDLITNGKNGVLVKPYDINEFTRKISDLMSDDKKRERLYKNIVEDRSLKERFAISKIITDWEKLFSSLKNGQTIN